MGNWVTKTLSVSGYAMTSLALVTLVVRREKTLFAKPLLLHGSAMALLALEIGMRLGDEGETKLTRFIGTSSAAAACATGVVLLFSLGEMITLPSAVTDGLTQLPNRMFFEAALDKTLRRLRNHKISASSAVVFVDLDNFKSVNDRFGHACGDLVLIEVGKRLRALAAAPNVAARIAGDEFAVLLADVRLDGAAAMIAKIRTSLAAPFFLDGSVVTIGASVGSSLVDGTRDAAAVMRCADEAMYDEKHLSTPRPAR